MNNSNAYFTSILVVIALVFTMSFVKPTEVNLATCQILSESEAVATVTFSQCKETYCPGSKMWVCEDYGNSDNCEPAACSSQNCL